MIQHATEQDPKHDFTLDQTLHLIRERLEAKWDVNALALLGKAEIKASQSEEYAARMEAAFLRGSTVEYRDLFSDFGDYWEPPRTEMPFYPHHDAVNAIDSAMLHIRTMSERRASSPTQD